MQTVSRRGFDSVKTEEATTPPAGLHNKPSTSQRHQASFSPSKRQRQDLFDLEPIVLNFDGVGSSEKRQTLV